MSANRERKDGQEPPETSAGEEMRLADVAVDARTGQDPGELHFSDVNVNAPVKRPLDLGEMSLADVDINAPARLGRLLEALKTGADHDSEDPSRRELTETLERILRDEAPSDPELAARLMELLRPLTAGNGASLEPPPRLLTPREIEVLQLLSTGLTNRQIAQKLVLSAGTVRTHVQHIIAKLEVSDRTQAAVKASRLGLISEMD